MTPSDMTVLSKVLSSMVVNTQREVLFAPQLAGSHLPDATFTSPTGGRLDELSLANLEAGIRLGMYDQVHKPLFRPEDYWMFGGRVDKRARLLQERLDVTAARLAQPATILAVGSPREQAFTPAHLKLVRKGSSADVVAQAVTPRKKPNPMSQAFDVIESRGDFWDLGELKGFPEPL
jgi:hypothetical protein